MGTSPMDYHAEDAHAGKNTWSAPDRPRLFPVLALTLAASAAATELSPGVRVAPGERAPDQILVKMKRGVSAGGRDTRLVAGGGVGDPGL
jgi:hypothetical protein